MEGRGRKRQWKGFNMFLRRLQARKEGGEGEREDRKGGERKRERGREEGKREGERREG